MARKPTYGTPDQSRAYVFPRTHRLRGIIGWSGVAAVVFLVAADILTTRRIVLSPGPLSKSHALAGGDCAKCHDPFDDPADARCIGCHEPRASVSRFTATAHAERVHRAGAAAGAAHAAGATPRCLVCHTEHRGRAASIAVVRDHLCRDCHGFRSLGSGHPEIRLVSDKIRESPGLQFPHKKHLEELQKTKGLQAAAACEVCHRLTPGRDDFAPLTFDRDCWSCHFQKGVTNESTAPLPADRVVSAETIAATDAAAAWARDYVGDFEKVRDRLVKKTIRHRDAWILYNATRLAAALTSAPEASGGSAIPEEIAGKIAALRGELDEVVRARADVASARDPAETRKRLADQEAGIARLAAEVADLDAGIAGSAPDTSAPPAPVREEQIRASLQEIDAALGLLEARGETWAREEAGRLRTKRAALAGRSGDPGPGWSAAGVSARRSDLARLIEDLSRVGAPPGTLASLRRDLESVDRSAIAAAPAATGAGEDDLRASLQEIDAVLALLSSRSQAWAQEEASRLRAKRDALALRAGRGGGAWSPAGLSAHRSDLVAMMDTLARAGAPAAQVSALRRELDAISAPSASGPGVASLRAERDARARQIAAARQEVQRLRGLLEQQPANASAETEDLDLRRSQIEAEIQALEQVSRSPAPAPAPAGDAQEVEKTLSKMLKPCLKCHVQVNYGIGKTAAARSVMPGAAFTHRPHVQQAGCLDCHARILVSEDSADISLDGIAKCQGCHKWGGSGDDCRTCHVYHPGAPAANFALSAARAASGGPS